MLIWNENWDLLSRCSPLFWWLEGKMSVYKDLLITRRGPLGWGNKTEIIHPLVDPQTQPYINGSRGDPSARLSWASHLSHTTQDVLYFYLSHSCDNCFLFCGMPLCPSDSWPLILSLSLFLLLKITSQGYLSMHWHWINQLFVGYTNCSILDLVSRVINVSAINSDANQVSFLENYFKSFLGSEIKEYSSHQSVQDFCLK